MDAAIYLVIGLIIGWSLNWVIQPLFRPRSGPLTDVSGLNEALADIQVRLTALEKASAGDPPRILTVVQESTVAQVYVKEKDALEQIDGLSPGVARRLNEAGIYTFDELANASPTRIQELVGAVDWLELDLETWIQQAGELAQEPR